MNTVNFKRRAKRFFKTRIHRKPDIILPFDDQIENKEAEVVKIDWPEEVKKPRVGLIKDCKALPYWTKYKRFLENNDFEYDFYDIHKSDWKEKGNYFDVIVWSPMTNPYEIEELRNKTYFFENYLNKICYPSFKTLMLFDNKIMQYYLMEKYDFPHINTFISWNYDETLKKIPELKYPLVCKTSTGAASSGVSLIKNEKDAKRTVDKIFSIYGKKMHWKSQRQKNYVYFQDFYENEGYDLRIIVVDEKIFGFYRDVPEGDFRASGKNTVRKGKLPIEAIKVAVDVYKKLDGVMLAVDMLKGKGKNEYKIIEFSPFIRLVTAMQLIINGVPGVYYLKDDKLFFKNYVAWLQENMLKTFFEKEYLNKIN